jgi:hypothetical protein
LTITAARQGPPGCGTAATANATALVALHHPIVIVTTTQLRALLPPSPQLLVRWLPALLGLR